RQLVRRLHPGEHPGRTTCGALRHDTAPGMRSNAKSFPAHSLRKIVSPCRRASHYLTYPLFLRTLATNLRSFSVLNIRNGRWMICALLTKRTNASLSMYAYLI